jgi:hypothetical protein
MAKKSAPKTKSKVKVRKLKAKLSLKKVRKPKVKKAKPTKAVKKKKRIALLKRVVVVARKPYAAMPSFKEYIKAQKGFELTSSQEEAISLLDRFFRDSKKPCFLLKGYAGTGKTFLIKVIADFLASIPVTCRLAAPTGRAAQVLSMVVGRRVQTIHGLIYDFQVLADLAEPGGPSPRFFFDVEANASNPRQIVYIIDESSMVSDEPSKQKSLKFGSGRLLSDLLKFTKVKIPDTNAKIIFVGDPFQLPPPTGGDSVALDKDYLLEHHKLPCVETEMTKVMRHLAGSGILSTATGIRRVIASGLPNFFNIDYSKGDVTNTGIEKNLCPNIARAFLADDSDGIAIRWKNEDVFNLNIKIREEIWKNGMMPLQVGDRLIVTQNNHLYGLINGEFLKVIKVAKNVLKYSIPVTPKDPAEPPYRLQFLEVTFQKYSVSAPDNKVTCLILHDYLWSKSRDVSDDEFDALYFEFSKHFYKANPTIYRGNPKPAEFLEALRRDPYFNALRVKFGYALTCQKSQGGQWKNVGVVFDSGLGYKTEGFKRWAYTAVTRAQDSLMVVDPPRYTPFTGSLKRKPTTTLLAPKGTYRFVNPVALKDYIEKIIHPEIESLKITITHLKSDTYFRQYKFEKDGKSVRLHYGFNGLGFFSDLKALPGSDGALESMLFDIIEKYA